jgi:hypothetical protein
MDAAALYAFVDVLAPMEIDMRTGHSSFAKVNERHAALRRRSRRPPTCRCAPRSRAGIRSARSDQISRAPRLRRLLPSVLRRSSVT